MPPSKAPQLDLLLKAGLYAQALRVLGPRLDRRDPVMVALYSELLLRAERFAEAQEWASTILTMVPQKPSALSHAHETLGLIAARHHNIGDADVHFDAALRYAHQTADQHRTCQVLISSLPFRLDVRGVAGVSELASETRRAVLRTGAPHLFAALHLRFASIEMRRGDGALSARHLDAAEVSLKEAPNSFLSSQRLAASSITNWLCDRAEAAFADGEAALKLAAKDGHTFVQMSALSNLALFALLAGDLARSAKLLDEALPLVQGAHVERCVLDTKAQLHLAQGNVDAAEECLRRISPVGWDQTGEVEPTWPDLEVNVTRIELLRRRGRLDQALILAEKAAAAVRQRGEWMLEPLLTVRHAQVLLESGAKGAAERALGPLLDRRDTLTLHVLAEVEQLKGRVLVLSGRAQEGRRSLGRGLRIARGLGRGATREAAALSAELDQSRRTKVGGWSAIETLAVCNQLVGRPDLLGAELMEMLVESSAVRRARFLSTRGGPVKLVHRVGKKKSNVRAPSAIVLGLGKLDGVTYELHIESNAGVGCRAIIASICKLVSNSLVRHRFEEEAKHRGSLWPIEEGLLLEQNLFVAPRMREIQTTARRVGPSDLPVLITGETGSGKEVIAREVHDSSPRAGKSFGVVVCSGVPREILDSHLFGHRRGAFTGAIENFLGVIRANEGGTLFLDEIGEVSLDLQVKLLRFLETGEVHPLGEVRPVKVDVRIVAATNQPLEALIKAGRFREDLYYRLNVVRVTIPPLRDRREEILPFFERFLIRECARLGRPVPELTDEAIEHLLLYRWPGNVRQVLNEAKRIMATLPPGEKVVPGALSSDIAAERQAAIERAVAASPNQMLVRTNQPLAAALEQVERALLTDAIAHSPDLETAAAKLDITRKGLFLKRQRLGLDVP